MCFRVTSILLACLAGVFSVTINTSSSLVNEIEPDNNNEDNDMQYLRTIGNLLPIYSEITSSQTIDMTSQMKSSSNSTETAEACLLSFAKHLRSFINERYFDFSCFERGIDMLKSELTRVSIFVMYMIPRNQNILKKLVSESQKFKEMQNSSRLLTMYNFLGRVDHELVSRMVELNVRLISLKTMDDKLDRSVKNYSHRLFEAWRDMCLYEERFERLVNVSAFTTAEFRFQLDQAAVTIEGLWTQVPESEYNVDES
ncbi:hypothetical protein OXX79_000083 [Metschnikowia pulcherrima]